MNPRHDKQTRTYSFGSLTFNVTGIKVFCAGPRLIEKINDLSDEDLKEANTEAWKQRRKLAQEINRKSNVSIYGWDDARDMHCEIAIAVCGATWRVLKIRGRI